MRVTRLKSPYDQEGSTNFPKRLKPGCYLIYSGDRLMYVGYSGSDVYKTMYRHFQSWKDNTQSRTTYSKADNKIKVRMIYCYNSKQAAKLERALILKYEPKDNINKLAQYELSPMEEYTFTEFEDTSPEPIVAPF